MDKTLKMTKSEEELMMLFWSKDEPLTSVELLEMATEHTWVGNYIHIMLRSLIKKGMIMECGTIQYGTQYARKFVPVITREEYMAKSLLSKNFDIKAVAGIMVAMAKEEKHNEELIKYLEGIVEEFETRRAM